MPLESQTQTTILRWLAEQPGCEAIKLHIGGYSRAGDPDIIGCYRGRMFLIEVKQPRRNPTNLQWHRMGQWVAAGAAVGIAHSLDEVKTLWAGPLWEQGAGIVMGCA